MSFETASAILVLCVVAVTLAFLWSYLSASIDRRIKAAIGEELARRP